MSIRRSIKVLFTFPRVIFHVFARNNSIGKGTWIARNVFLCNNRIGKYVYIGANCVINYARIGNYCSIAPAVQIGGMEHSYQNLTTCNHLSSDQEYGKETIIGDDVWLGAGCIIKQGIKIGRGAVVGANSFVNKDVEPYSVVFGTPAKLYKYRFNQEVQQLLDNSKYWMMDKDDARQCLTELNLIINEGVAIEDEERQQ